MMETSLSFEVSRDGGVVDVSLTPSVAATGEDSFEVSRDGGLWLWT